MTASRKVEVAPEDFLRAVTEIDGVPPRSWIEISEMAAPRRIAPWAHAISGDVVIDDGEIGTGRFVLLHDPAGHDAWSGTFRCVTFAQAEIDQDMASDPLLTDVGASWLIDALNANGAQYSRPAGSVTVVRSSGFGDLAPDPTSAQIEIRASWSPTGSLSAHVEAWMALLAQICGLPPESDDVIPLARKRARK